jgi:phospholipid/cholesterol/gamma-HCH transport system substrate-binding protein
LKRRRGTRLPNIAAGAIGILVIAAICWIVFGGPIPFTGTGFKLRAVYTSETELHLDSPVRIAGVNVGEVTGINHIGGDSPATLVTMSIEHSGLPIHADATTAIRPRLFLEGNYYINLQPGTPEAPSLNSGATLSSPHNNGPVQLDRVLSALNSNARRNLQTLLQGLGDSLNKKPTAAEDASQDPSERGLTAGQSLNRSLNYSANAFRASAIVNQALLGEKPHDLSGVVAGTEKFFSGLAADQASLAGLVTTFNSTMRALANRQQDLAETIGLLPGTLNATNDALGPLQASFAPTQRFAAQILPGVKATGPAIAAGLPWLAQTQALVSRSELGGLLQYLTPAVQDTGTTVVSLQGLLRGSGQLAVCFTHTIIPTGNERVVDPPITTGLQDYQELFQSAVGIASAAQGFDGAGRFVRSSLGGGSDLVQTKPSATSQGPVYGNAVLPPLGTRPVFTDAAPPINRTALCGRQAPPKLNSATTGEGP